MPGGVSSLNQTLPDLESFLVRRRIKLKVWLDSKHIATIEAFNKFLGTNSSWTISQNLVDQVQELLKPAQATAKPTVEVLTEPVLPISVEESSVSVDTTEYNQEVFEQPIEESVASISEELPQMVEEVSVVSSQSFKERKKSR